MSWTTTLQYGRRNGQWTEVTGGGGGGGGDGGDGTVDTSRYYTTEPTRSGNTYVYNGAGNNFSSMQAAHDALSPGDTLEFDGSNTSSSNPYIGRMTVTTDNITITSVDPNDRAWIEEPDNTDYRVFDIGDGNRPSVGSEASLAQPISGGGLLEDGNNTDVGDEVIHVTDASPFSVGDDVEIWEDYKPYGAPDGAIGGASRGVNDTSEYREVTAVDTVNDTITVHHPMFLPFPNTNPTNVGIISWLVEDVRMSSLRVRSIPGSSNLNQNQRQPVKFDGVKYAWADNLHLMDSDRHSLMFSDSMHCRAHNIDMIDGDGYGTNVTGTQFTYCTNIVGDGIVNYTVRGGSLSTDILIDGCVGKNYQSKPSPVAATHWGGFFVEYRDVYSDNEQVTRYRTQEMTIDGFESYQHSGIPIVYSQRPINVTLKNGIIGNYVSASNDHIFHFRLDDTDVEGAREYAENVTIENVDIEQKSGMSITELGTFDTNASVDGLHLKNVTYGGTTVTESDVRAWPGFSDTKVSNLTVE